MNKYHIASDFISLPFKVCPIKQQKISDCDKLKYISIQVITK